MTRKYPTFCDPTIDWAFKRIFGSVAYKDATIGFINSLLPEKKITDVDFLNVEIPGFSAESRNACVDVLCRSEDGSSFILEMQVAPQEFFKQRTVLYAAILISHMAEKGNSWDYSLKPTYVISVIDFKLDGEQPESCISHYVSKEVNSGIPLNGATEFFFVEPRRFKKNLDELSNIAEKWLYLLRDAKKLEAVPDSFVGDKAFDAYFNASRTANLTKQERIDYDRAMVTKTDIANCKEYAFRQGEKKGLAKGLSKGKAEGLAKGRAEGLAEGTAKGRAEGLAEGTAKGKAEGLAEGTAKGRAEERLAVAKALLEDGVPREKIAGYTGLSPEEIAQL